MPLRVLLTDDIETAGTDGASLWLSPAFVARLDEQELEYVLMHLAGHVALLACDDSLQEDSESADRARDIVVNSCVLAAADGELRAITLGRWGGVQEHQTPNGREGRDLTCAEARRFLALETGPRNRARSGWDWHPSRGQRRAVHPSDVAKAAEATRRETTGGERCLRGGAAGPAAGTASVPAFVDRWLEAEGAGRADWHSLLDCALATGPEDYDFCPPDRRSPEPFLLPFPGDIGRSPRDVLFMLDSSASVKDQELAEELAEVRGAVSQLGQGLRGWVGFFDTEVTEPVPFESVQDVEQARPSGHGGTSFHAVFSYVREHRGEIEPACIVILTDGMAPFPSEDEADGVPVVWVLNNDAAKPPWGHVGRTVPPSREPLNLVQENRTPIVSTRGTK